jgi:hypothetical protein
MENAMDDTMQQFTSETGASLPGIALTSEAQQYLNQTRPWARFVSIMMFIGSGFAALLGLGMIVLGAVGGFTPSGRTGSAMPFGSTIGLIPIGLFYLAMAVVFYLIPGVFLAQYAGAIRSLETNPSAEALETILKSQKTFWKYVGILIIVGLILTVLTVMGVFIFAFVAASSVSRY